MNKTHLALEDLSAPRHLSSSIREIDWPVPDELPITDLVQLYAQIGSAMNDYDGLIVQFVSLTAGCGGELIALDMAWVAATVLGRDILVLDATTSAGKNGRGYTSHINGNEIVQTSSGRPMSLESHMMKVFGQSLYIADLHDACGNARALAMTDEIVDNLRKLTPRFDMIIVASPPAEIDPFSSALAYHVDANLLVVEAEQTRRAQALQIRQILARCGRPLLGAVLNNRRNHLPNWLGQ
jgi:Mrp family chromosome partitioning ATPase